MKSQALKYIPVNLANILISFGTIITLTRLLSAAEFGRYALVITTLNFFHMGLFTWLEASMARFHERAAVGGRLNTHFKTLYLSAISIGALSIPIGLFLIYTLPIDNRLRLLLTFALISSVLQLFYNLTMEAHKAAHRIGRYSAVHSTQLVLSFGLGVILIMLTPLKEAGPIIGMIIGACIAILVQLPGLFTRMRGSQFDAKLIREYFFYGTPICFALVLSYALENGDLFFIKYFMSDQAVGAYNAGYSLASRSLDFLFAWLAMAAMPIIISTFERRGKDGARKALSEYGNLLVIITLPTAMGIALVSNEVVFVLGEPVRNDAAIIMPWIAFAALLNGFINFYVHQAYVLAKKLNVLAAIMIVPVLVNIGLNIILIPLYGLHGAVIATVSAYIVALILSVIGALKVFGLPLPFQMLAKSAAACGVMALCVTNIPLGADWPDISIVLVKAIFGAVIYGLSMYILAPASIRKLLRLS